MVTETFILYYCLCSGVGLDLASPCDPCIMADSKLFCVQSHMSTEETMTEESGLCFKKSKVCCCIEGLACPPGGGGADGLPMFGCCGIKCGGEDKGADGLPMFGCCGIKCG